YLSHYLKNFHKEQLRIGVWRRVVRLNDLEINTAAFDHLQLPFSIHHGKIGSLSLQLSMKRLGREPCVSVTISDVLIVMAPRANHEWSEGPAVVRERAAKRAALAAAEVVKMSEQGNGVGASALSYFSAVGLNALEVLVTSVHVKYTHSSSDPKVRAPVFTAFYCFAGVISSVLILMLCSSAFSPLQSLSLSPLCPSGQAAFEFGLHLDHLSVAAAASKDPLAAAAAAAADAIASASASALNTAPAAGGPAAAGDPGSTASFFAPPDSQTPTERLLEQQWEQETGQEQGGGQGKPQIGDAGRKGGAGRNLRKSIEVRGLSFYWNSRKRGFEGSTAGPTEQGGGEGRTGKEGAEGGERWRQGGAVRGGSGERGGEESMDADIVWGEGELVPSDDEEGGGMGAKRQRRKEAGDRVGTGRGQHSGGRRGEEGTEAVANNMLHPLDASIRLVMHIGPPVHTSTAPVSVSLRCNRLRVSLEEHQYQDVLLLADALNVLRLRERYGRFRPAALFSSTQNTPTNGTTNPADNTAAVSDGQQGGSSRVAGERVHALWSYALNAVLFDVRQRLYRRSFLYLPSRLAKRRQYTALYKRKLELLQDLPVEERQQLEEMEDELELEDILLFRTAAAQRAARTEWANPSTSKDSTEDASVEKDRRGDRRKGKAAQQKQQQQRRGRGWLNWLSQGMLGAGGSDASAAADVMAAVSDRDLEELYRTLDSPFDAADGDNGLDEPSWMSTSASTSSSASMAMDATSAAAPRAMNRSRSSVHTLSFSESSSSLDACIPEDSSVTGPSSRVLPHASHRTTHGRAAVSVCHLAFTAQVADGHASLRSSYSRRDILSLKLRGLLLNSRVWTSSSSLSLTLSSLEAFDLWSTSGAAKGTLDASASFAGPGSQGMRAGVGMGGGISSERSQISPSSSHEDEAVRILFPQLPHASLHDFLPPSHPSHPSFHSAASSFASPSTVSSPSPAGHGHLLLRSSSAAWGLGRPALGAGLGGPVGGGGKGQMLPRTDSRVGLGMGVGADGRMGMLLGAGAGIGYPSSHAHPHAHGPLAGHGYSAAHVGMGMGVGNGGWVNMRRNQSALGIGAIAAAEHAVAMGGGGERGIGGGDVGGRGYGGESEMHGWRPGRQMQAVVARPMLRVEIEVHLPHSHGHGHEHGHEDGGVGGNEVEGNAPNEMETTISVAVEPVQAVVGVEVLKRVGMFFSHPTTVPTHQEQVIASINSLDSTTARATAKSGLVLATRKVLHLHVDVASVTIVVPHADTYLSARPCPLL
ncbi:unnamed protein product, partial [Closterium sp. NIES-53]